jgi:2-phosphosulfolactate phosphatase
MSEHFKHKVHVLFSKEDLDHERLEGKVAIVLDVLFATSTIINAFAAGANEVIPTLDEAGANAEAQQHPEGSYVLAGELYAVTLPGFAPPTPIALTQHNLKGRTVIYSTTNGTVALKQSAKADHVYAGALVNAKAVVKRVLDKHAGKTVLIVCSGSMGSPNLEDMYGAGYFVDLLCAEIKGDSDTFSDASLAARALFRSEPSEQALLKSRVGRLMIERGLEHEVRFAAQLGVLDVVPELTDGRLTV